MICSVREQISGTDQPGGIVGREAPSRPAPPRRQIEASSPPRMRAGPGVACNDRCLLDPVLFAGIVAAARLLAFARLISALVSILVLFLLPKLLILVLFIGHDYFSLYLWHCVPSSKVQLPCHAS